jgi:hypothetical protein
MRHVALFDVDAMVPRGLHMPPKVFEFDYLSPVSDETLVFDSIEAAYGRVAPSVRKGDVPRLWMVSW